MELEDIKQQWQSKQAIKYSQEELESIFSIKRSRLLGEFKYNLSLDLIIAELVAVGFIVVLQLLDLSTSNFWSLMMAFLAVQHLVLYQIQNYLIQKQNRFSTDVKASLELSINNLTNLLWHYRIWPMALSTGLYLYYVLQFRQETDAIEKWAIGLLLVIGVGLISNALSAVMVRNHLRKIKKVKASYITTSQED